MFKLPQAPVAWAWNLPTTVTTSQDDIPEPFGVLSHVDLIFLCPVCRNDFLSSITIVDEELHDSTIPHHALKAIYKGFSKRNHIVLIESGRRCTRIWIWRSLAGLPLCWGMVRKLTHPGGLWLSTSSIQNIMIITGTWRPWMTTVEDIDPNDCK